MSSEPISDAQLLEAASALAEHCRSHQWRLATAESCTGGWLARCCTDVPGSSQWFECGWVTYSNAAKEFMLGVPAELIQRHGAVSQSVVEAMAAQALQHADCDLACAISGVAGPTGGTARTPVGMVWFGFAQRGRTVVSEVQNFQGDREGIRRSAVWYALNRLLQL